MKEYELIAPCHFGMESVIKREIYDIGYDITEVVDGRVTFAGDAEAIARTNIGLRTAERILLKVGSFKARTFEELFQGTKALPWEDFLPKDARFWVTKAASVKSKLFSTSDIQSVMKKAMVERMKSVWNISTFPETGADYPVRVFLMKDEVTVTLDTTGASLHKRGYRKMAVKAPIAENLAAGLLMLTPWKPDRILVDPFCGSGTFLIEAAMMAADIAPGLTRHFTAESWANIVPSSVWEDARQEAQEQVRTDVACHLQGYDIDPEAIAAARENARLAGVEKLIHFQVKPVAELSNSHKYGFIITNPPYGDRLKNPGVGSRRAVESIEEAQDPEGIAQLYRTLGERFRALDTWSLYVISAYDRCEEMIGRKAARNRKIYNGMIRTYFYMFPGPRPPKRPAGSSGNTGIGKEA